MNAALVSSECVEKPTRAKATYVCHVNPLQLSKIVNLFAISTFQTAFNTICASPKLLTTYAKLVHSRYDGLTGVFKIPKLRVVSNTFPAAYGVWAERAIYDREAMVGFVNGANMTSLGFAQNVLEQKVGDACKMYLEVCAIDTRSKGKITHISCPQDLYVTRDGASTWGLYTSKKATYQAFDGAIALNNIVNYFQALSKVHQDDLIVF